MTSACSGPSEGSITLPPQAPPGTGVTSRLRHGLIARLSAVAVLLLGLTAGLAGSGLARTGPESIAPLAEKLLDAVVNISTTQTVKGSSGAPLPNVPKGSPFEELFDDFFKKGKGRPERKQSSLGSGFVIDGKEGLIVTNFHVIDGADEIIINFNDGTKLKVEKVIGKDTKTDLALLKVTPKKPLAAVPWGPSAKVRVGDWVVAIGNPFGLGGSVSVGIISAKQRDISSGPYDDYLQTDAAINKGNSGGPLFNMDGEVIGVNTAIISPSGGSIGIGFAVPSETAIFVVDQLRRHGEIRRGWLGVNVQSLNEGLSEEFGSPPGVGALVTRVTPGSPADAAGIKARDVIVRFDGKDISTMRGLPRAVAQTEVGREVEVVVLRDGQRISFKVKVARLVEEPEAKKGPARAPEHVVKGLKLAPLTDELRKTNGLPERLKGVVVIEVEAGSVAAQRGFVIGDVIFEAAGEPVASLDDLVKAHERVRTAKRPSILLKIENAKGEIRSVAMPIDP